MAKKDREEGNFRQKRIAFCSPSPGSGVSFAASSMAFALAKSGNSVSLAELGSAHFYRALGMEKRFCMSGFCDFYKMLEEGRDPVFRENIYAGVNWMVKKDHDTGLSHARMFRFLNRMPGSHAVWDCSGLSGQLLEEILGEADSIYVVLDPLPTALLACAEGLQRLRLLFPGAALIVNRMNGGVHKGELERYLGIKNYLRLPFLDPQIIYKAQYNCMLPFELSGGEKAVLGRDVGLRP